MDEKNNFHRPRKPASTKKIYMNLSLISISLITVIVIVTLSQSSIGSLSTSASHVQETEPQFNLDVTYAYVGKGTSNVTFTDSQGLLLSPISQYPSAVYFNITRPTVGNILFDAILEVFNVTIVSDKGAVENFVFFTGTNYNPSFSDTELYALTEGIYDLFDVNTVDGITGHFCFNWTADESILSAKIGSYGTFTNYKNDLGLWSAGQPNIVSISFYRIGYVTMTNRAILIQQDMTGTANKTQVQLQKYGEGFLKNEILPMDKLSQNNRFQPLK